MLFEVLQSHQDALSSGRSFLRPLILAGSIIHPLDAWGPATFASKIPCRSVCCCVLSALAQRPSCIRGLIHYYSWSRWRAFFLLSALVLGETLA
jgi:hypothetical protein